MIRFTHLTVLASLTVPALGCGHYITRTVQRVDLRVFHADTNEPVMGGFVQLKNAPPMNKRRKTETISDEDWMLRHPSFTSATDAKGGAILHVTELGYESGSLPNPAELVRDREFVCVVDSNGTRDVFRIIIAPTYSHHSKHFMISVSEVSEPCIREACWEDGNVP